MERRTKEKPGNGISESYRMDMGRRILVLNVLSVIGIAIMFFFGIVAFYQGNHVLGCFDLSMAFILVGTLVYLRKSGNYAFASLFSTCLTAVFFLYLFVTGGPNNTGHLWYYTFPLFSSYLLGSKRGAIAASLLLFLSVLFLTVDHLSPIFTTYAIDFKIRFIVSYLIVFAYSYVIESARDKTQQKLSYRNTMLEELVEKLKQTQGELREAKETAEAASRSKSDFLANMSHELRTPLNHIIGFTQMVVDEKFGDLNEVQAEYLEDVLQSSEHLLSLINDILDLSKVEAGKLELNPEDVQLKKLFNNSLAMVKERVMKHRIRLNLDMKRAPEVIRADERKLKQIIYNLLSNAAKFTQDGGEIMVSANRVRGSGPSDAGSALSEKKTDHQEEAAAHYVEISVQDTGIGIKAEDHIRIFSPFEQVESSTSRKFHGTGLGLSLARRLVELHGGRI